ncbi:uncharacterized protein LOC143265071 [Megachile rotundata]|uniref:uncharacterized protein LOC143265071 n=1 Tax=Megachile rotundata TaxID=143995 RepID=UPI003FD021E4
MEYVDVPRLKHDKPKSLFCDKYLQPPRRRSFLHNRPFKKPTLKIESDTTYSLSYFPHKDSRCKFHYGAHEKVPRVKPGKFDFETTYKLSYQFSKLVKTKTYVPKSCLSIKGSHDMMTTHALSYVNPGYSRAKICEPYRGKGCQLSMDSKTVTKESYQGFGAVKVRRPAKPEVWRTKFKNDYQTTNKMSYQYTGPVKRSIRVGRYRPTISSKIEGDTVYNTSYQVPGRFVNGGCA